MKNIHKIILIILCLWFGKAHSQPIPDNTQDCHPDGPFITTAPVPYTGQSYQTNTWDWTQQHLPASNNSNYVSQSQLNNNPLPAGLENPFYQLNMQYLSAIAGGTNSDFYPADGWELIKRDFGMLSGGSQNSICSPAPYFILYNKYSGKLRVLASAYGLGLHQTVSIDLKFADQSDWQNLNLSNYKVSGLFTHYNNPPLALDQNSPPIGTIYSTPAVFPSNDYAFFYGDFQMAYDPCTCLFQSGLEVDFRIVDQLDASLGGGILGVNIPITDNADQNIIDPTHNWLSSVSHTGYNVNGGLQIYNNIHNMEQEFIANQQQYLDALWAAQGIGTAIGIIGGVFTAAGQIANGLSVAGAVPAPPATWTGSQQAWQDAYANSLAANGKLGGYLQGLGANVSFFGAQAQQYSSPNGGPPTEPFVLYAQTQLAGTITETTKIGAESIILGTPGSAGSPSLPEVTTSSPYNVPPYPEYDEILGVFALLKTPNVIRYNWTDMIVTPAETLYIPNHAYGLQSPSEIQYAFNPAANVYLNNTIVQAAWEDEINDAAMGYTAANNAQVFAGSGGNMSPVNFYDGLIDEISPFMDLTHFQNLCINPPEVGQFPSTSGQPNPTEDILSTDNLYIKFNIVFTSIDAGRNGLLNTSIFTVRYNIPSANIIDQNVPGRTAAYNGFNPGVLPPLSFSPYVNIPLQNYTISANTNLTTDLTGYYNIYINAPITNTGSTPINIIAANDIIIGNGGSVGPNINLIILSNLGIPAGNPIPPVSTSDISSFCNSNNYKANQATTKPVRSDTVQQSATIQNTFAINLYPNPATSQCAVRFTEAAGADVTITLVDVMGREVATIDHNWHNQGTSFVPFSTEGYAPGVYTVKFTDGTNTSTQRLTIAGKY